MANVRKNQEESYLVAHGERSIVSVSVRGEAEKGERDEES